MGKYLGCREMNISAIRLGRSAQLHFKCNLVVFISFVFLLSFFNYKFYYYFFFFGSRFLF